MADPSKKIEPPGWNDPPMLNYSQSNPPPKTRIQNKRVMHSFNSSSSSNSAGPVCLPEGAPPQPTSFSPESYEKAKENFENVLNMVGGNNEVKESIQKMLKIWQSGVLTENTQKCLLQLSNCLVEADIVKCNELHFTLCMNSSPQMTSYFQAIKNLIEIRGKNA